VYWSIDQIDSVLIFFACFCIAVGDTINGDNKGCDPICTLDSVHVRISIALCRGRFCVHWFEVRDFVDIVVIDVRDEACLSAQCEYWRLPFGNLYSADFEVTYLSHPPKLTAFPLHPCPTGRVQSL
jgi:hypothetical protein